MHDPTLCITVRLCSHRLTNHYSPKGSVFSGTHMSAKGGRVTSIDASSGTCIGAAAKKPESRTRPNP